MGNLESKTRLVAGTIKASAWIEDHLPSADAPYGIRTEAAELLGVDADYPGDHFHLAEGLSREGKLREAIAEYSEAIRLGSTSVATFNNLAWLLATSADVTLRDPRQAVEHATKAVELDPQCPSCWNTLGVAHYRNGAWKEAITALEHSVELRSRSLAHDWLFLAMAHWQIDQKDRAREWYEKAAAWMKEHEVDDELARFRAEADELLGIEEAAPKTPDKTESSVSNEATLSGKRKQLED